MEYSIVVKEELGSPRSLLAYRPDLDEHDYLSETELFISGCDSLSFEEGAIIITEGSFSGRIYSITQGTCKLLYYNDTTAKLKEGDIFGHIEFLLGTKAKGIYTKSVVALTKVTVTFIEPYFLNILTQYYPHIAVGFLLQLVQTLY